MVMTAMWFSFKPVTNAAKINSDSKQSGADVCLTEIWVPFSIIQMQFAHVVLELARCACALALSNTRKNPRDQTFTQPWPGGF